MEEKWICFVQPTNERGDPEYVFLTEASAIEAAKDSHKKAKRPDLTFTDAEYLDEFMVVHWAWRVRKPNVEGIQ